MLEVVCPKCNNLMLESKITGMGFGITTVGHKVIDKASLVNSYVCPNCGYIELYVDKLSIFR